MSNAMYGKITDNLRIRNDVKLVSNREHQNEHQNKLYVIKNI